MPESHSPANASPNLAELFSKVKTIAVVGYSDKPERAGHFVPAYLREAGYAIIAVNPKFSASVNGFPAYPDLASIPPETVVDVVDVFRSPEAVPAIVDDAASRSPRPACFWMQPGAENEAAAEKARMLGMVPILGLCMLAEHKRLVVAGSLPARR